MTGWMHGFTLSAPSASQCTTPLVINEGSGTAHKSLFFIGCVALPDWRNGRICLCGDSVIRMLLSPNWVRSSDLFTCHLHGSSLSSELPLLISWSVPRSTEVACHFLSFPDDLVQLLSDSVCLEGVIAVKSPSTGASVAEMAA
jgi:hypothetical protein